MKTREDVHREVSRMLHDDSVRKPRVLQFFRDYFDYDLGGYICKDSKALADTGVSNRGTSHYRAMFDATASTDRLIELILHEDKDVLKQLLTTDKVVSVNSDRTYFGRKNTKKERAASVAAAKKAEAEAFAQETVVLENRRKGTGGVRRLPQIEPGRSHGRTPGTCHEKEGRYGCEEEARFRRQEEASRCQSQCCSGESKGRTHLRTSQSAQFR